MEVTQICMQAQIYVFNPGKKESITYIKGVRQGLLSPFYLISIWMTLLTVEIRKMGNTSDTRSGIQIIIC
jgi:hypothetical protein